MTDDDDDDDTTATMTTTTNNDDDKSKPVSMLLPKKRRLPISWTVLARWTKPASTNTIPADDICTAFDNGHYQEFIERITAAWTAGNAADKKYITCSLLPSIIFRFVGIASLTLLFDMYAGARDPTSPTKLATVLARCVYGRRLALSTDGPGMVLNRLPMSYAAAVSLIDSVTNRRPLTYYMLRSFAAINEDHPSVPFLYAAACRMSELMDHLPPYAFFGGGMRSDISAICWRRPSKSIDVDPKEGFLTNLSLAIRVLRSCIVEGIGDRTQAVFYLLALARPTVASDIMAIPRAAEMFGSADRLAAAELIETIGTRLASRTTTITTIALPTITQPAIDDMQRIWSAVPAIPAIDWTTGIEEQKFLQSVLNQIPKTVRRTWRPDNNDDGTTKTDSEPAAVIDAADIDDQIELHLYLKRIDGLAIAAGRLAVTTAIDIGRNRKPDNKTTDDDPDTPAADRFPWTDAEIGPDPSMAAGALPRMELTGGTGSNNQKHNAYVDELYIWIGPYPTKSVPADVYRTVFRTGKMRDWTIPVPSAVFMAVTNQPDAVWLRIESPFSRRRYQSASNGRRGAVVQPAAFGVHAWTDISKPAMTTKLRISAADAAIVGTNETNESAVRRRIFAVENSPAGQLAVLQMARAVLGVRIAEPLTRKDAETWIVDVAEEVPAAGRLGWPMVIPSPIGFGKRQSATYGHRRPSIEWNLTAILFGRIVNVSDVASRHSKLTDVARGWILNPIKTAKRKLQFGPAVGAILRDAQVSVDGRNPVLSMLSKTVPQMIVAPQRPIVVE